MRSYLCIHDRVKIKQILCSCCDAIGNEKTNYCDDYDCGITLCPMCRADITLP